MKLTTIFLFAAVMQVSANSYGQVVSINMQDAPLETVFKEIEKQTGYTFVYAKDLIKKAKRVTVQIKNGNIDQVLTKCLEGQPFTYRIISTVITINTKPEISSPTNKITTGESPPTIDVKGRVVNDKGDPVVGATITVKGTSTMVSTNDNGFFVIKGVDENATLIISATDIDTKEIKVNGKEDLTTINVKVKVKDIDAVVINTGYQKVKANEVTGSFVHVNNEQLNRTPSPTILGRLNNISGLLFSGANQDLPSRSSIIIRGYNTIFSNREALIVLDNFPYEGDIYDINPNDIESVTVLKDAAAASIWGARAGNGVIIMTTKSGKYNQKTKVSFSAGYSITEKPDLFYAPVLSPSDYIDVETFLFKKGYYNAQISSPTMHALSPVIETLLRRQNGKISAADSAMQIDALRKLDVRNDLEKYVYETPLKQSYNINFSGGGPNQQYFLSGGYDFISNSTSSQINYDRISVTGSNTYSLLQKKLEISTKISYAHSSYGSNPVPLANVYPYSQLADAFGNPLPIDRYRRGYIDTAGGGKLLDWSFYPLLEKNFADNKTLKDYYRVGIDVKYTIFKGLDVTGSYQYLKDQSSGRIFRSIQTFTTRDMINQYTDLMQTVNSLRNPVPIGGILDQSYSNLTSNNLRGQISYNTTWKQLHKLTAMASAEIGRSYANSYQYREYGYNPDNGSNIPVDYVNSYKNFITGNPLKIQNNDYITGTDSRSVSFVTNLSYSYKSRYTIYASGRKDGANLFGVSTNNKWKPLWSVGGMWEINKESYYHIDFLPELKLRATYGYSGNINNSKAANLTIQYLQSNAYLSPQAFIFNPPNPDLRWEKMGMFNIGLDYALKGNRIFGRIEYYRKKNTDLISQQLIALSSGYSTVWRNSADTKGEGLEVEINTVNTLGKIKWTSNFLFSYSRNWISAYKLPLTAIGYYIGGGTDGVSPIVGKPVDAIYSYKWGGLDPITGDPQGYMNGALTKNYSGLNTSYNLNDMVYSGPATPPYFGSILNQIKWGNFSISCNIIYQLGFYFRRNSVTYNNILSVGGNRDYLLRWQKPGDEQFTNVPSMVYPANTDRDNFYAKSDILVEKGDFIRLQDINVSYDIKNVRTRKPMFKSINIQIYASNLALLWTANHKGIDPENRPANDFNTPLQRKSINGKITINF